MRQIPIRHLLAFSAAAICAYVALTVWLAPPQSDSLSFGRPAPLLQEFITLYLALPGIPAVLPLIVAGESFSAKPLVYAALVLGAGFFWYCVGAMIDSERAQGLFAAPRIAIAYLKMLSILSLPLALFWAVVGVQLEPAGCANGASPWWVRQVEYGIVMQWLALGSFFVLQRARARRESALLSLHL